MPSAAEEGAIGAGVKPTRSAIVLGADGFIGAHLLRRLTNQGWACHGIGRAAGDLALPGVADACLAAAPKTDRLFHLVTRQRTGPVQLGLQGELLRINASLHLHVLEAWRRHQPQAKLISTGSSCAFPECDRPLLERDFQGGPLHPSVEGYGLAKQLLAMGSRSYGQQYGLTWLHGFLATVYGPADHKAPDRAHFMGGLIERAVLAMHSGADRFEVWGDPGTVRDLLHVDDQIDALLAADQAFGNEWLNVTANAPVTVGEAASAVLKALHWQPEVVYPAGSFRGTSYKTLDSSRFLSGSGWRPKTDLGAGVRTILRHDYGIG